MTTTETPASQPTFSEELSRLAVKRRDNEPERAFMLVGVALLVLGIVLVVFAMQSAHTTSDPLVQNERIILAILGALVGLAGIVVWARYSVTRYLRYWLLRVIFEERLQQDRTVAVLERIDAKLGSDRTTADDSGAA
jgi:hypothetical protein